MTIENVSKILYTDNVSFNTGICRRRKFVPVVTGGLNPQMFLRRTIKRVMSNCFDDTVEGVEGYNLLHCVGLRTFFFSSVCRVVRAGELARTEGRFAGVRMPSNLFLSASDPTSIRRRHNRA